MEVRLEAFCEAEMDEQWSYVGKKSEQRWLYTQLIMQPAPYWRMSLVGVKIRSSIKLASGTPRKLNAKT